MFGLHLQNVIQLIKIGQHLDIQTYIILYINNNYRDFSLSYVIQHFA